MFFSPTYPEVREMIVLILRTALRSDLDIPDIEIWETPGITVFVKETDDLLSSAVRRSKLGEAAVEAIRSKTDEAPIWIKIPLQNGSPRWVITAYLFASEMVNKDEEVRICFQVPPELLPGDQGKKICNPDQVRQWLSRRISKDGHQESMVCC